MGIFKSMWQISRQVIFGVRPDVVFYYPQHFNRAADGSNPFFAPLIELCRNEGLRCLVLEEPAGTTYKKNASAVQADIIYWGAIVWRKLMMGFLKRSQNQSDMAYGRLLRMISLGKLKARCVVTISNSMIDVWAALNSSGEVYDYQHGIIYRGHPGYFTAEGGLRAPYRLPNVHSMLWGELYKRNLRELPDRVDSDQKFIVVGYPIYKATERLDNFGQKVALVSMQFTSDIDAAKSRELLAMLAEFLEEAVAAGYTVLLKHHPRFAGEVDLNPLLTRYDGKVLLCSEPLQKLARKIKLHITWCSTTAMEYAAYGIPTYFLRDYRFDWATNLFYGQYGYPLYDGMDASSVLARLADHKHYRSDSESIKEWYESAYSPLDKSLALRLLKGE